MTYQVKRRLYQFIRQEQNNDSKLSKKKHWVQEKLVPSTNVPTSTNFQNTEESCKFSFGFLFSPTNKMLVATMSRYSLVLNFNTISLKIRKIRERLLFLGTCDENSDTPCSVNWYSIFSFREFTFEFWFTLSRFFYNLCT